MKADVAVLVPSLNSPLLGQVVEAVLAQSGRERLAEVLVVGRDEAGLLPARPLVRFLDTGRPVSEPVARNLALRHSQAERLVFLDSDCLPEPGWLEAHLAAFEQGPRLVSGSVRTGPEPYWALVYNLALFYAFLDGAPAGARQALPTLNLSFPRALAEAIGPFDESLPRATDLEWTLRAAEAGVALHFEPAAAVRHLHARHGLRQVWRDCAGSGQHSRRIRLRYAALLRTPSWLRWRLVVGLLAPALAVAVTARIAFGWPATFRGRWHALPGVLLTRLAWGWGASRRSS